MQKVVACHRLLCVTDFCVTDFYRLLWHFSDAFVGSASVGLWQGCPLAVGLFGFGRLAGCGMPAWTAEWVRFVLPG